MTFTFALVPVLLGALNVRAQTTCTTLQPVFEEPRDATTTVFDNTMTSTSSVDCSGCSLVVSTFRAILNTSLPTSPTATTTQPITTSDIFVCSPSPPTTSTAAIASTVALPSPTASPLPPINPTAQSLIDELSTAFLYASLLANGGDKAKLCSVINPSSLSEIINPSINGSAVRQEVCALAAIDFTSPSLSTTAVTLNKRGVTYIATALFAMQVAGGYAGGTNLETLCSKIESTLIDDLFVGYVANVGTAAKNYVCSAASASGTATPTPIPASAPYPTNTATPSTPTCSIPTGFANTVVPAPLPLATENFQVAPAFTSKHTLFILTDSNIALSEASIASFCLDQCIAYKSNRTTSSCLSFNVNLGNPVPPTPPGPTQWFCSGFDAYLAHDGGDYAPVDVVGSYMFGLGVNRICDGSYRAY